MQKYLLLLFLLLPVGTMAQVSITGKVINIFDKKPIENVNVFLSNASVGSATHADGAFTLSNVRPGQYDLVVSMVGFETFQQVIRVGDKNIQLPAIEIEPKATALREVKVRPHDDWDRLYANFKKDFFGPSPNAEECKILNPDVLTLDFEKGTQIATGSSSDFLIVENLALGYRIKYLLKQFIHNYNTTMMHYEGLSLFEELPGTEGQKKRWKKARQEAFIGSSMDFLRAALANRVAEHGFGVFRLDRKNNPRYGKTDGELKYKETVTTPQLSIEQYIQPTNQKSTFAFTAPDTAHLYIVYTGQHVVSDKRIANNFDMTRFPHTVVDFGENYGLFDLNGVILNPVDVTFEGEWTKNRMADLLPVDYELGD